MKCDMHVHTVHSGMCTVPVFDRFCRESYNDPDAVYEALKRRGMELVTVTDHDSIGSSADLARYPDFFLSEEVTCIAPSGTRLHVGVYDIDEAQHLELQRRRNDLPAFLAYLQDQRLLFAINHAFSALTGSRVESDFELFATRFPALETLNGQMPAVSNRAAARFAARAGKAALAGSDAHVMASLGCTYTEVAGARCKQEFFDRLRKNLGTVAGASGSYWKLTAAVLEIASGMVAEHPWTLLFAPLFGVIPAATLASVLLEKDFASRWERRLGYLESRSWSLPGAGAEAAL